MPVRAIESKILPILNLKINHGAKSNTNTTNYGNRSPLIKSLWYNECHHHHHQIPSTKHNKYVANADNPSSESTTSEEGKEERSKISKFLNTKTDIWSQYGYRFLGLLYLSLTGMNFFAPDLLILNFISYRITTLAQLAVRSMGITLLLPTIFSYALQDAVVHKRMNSETYKRFALSLALIFTTVYFWKLQYCLSNQILFQLSQLITISIIQLLPLILYFKVYGISELSKIISGFFSGIYSILHPKNSASILYSFLTPLSLLLALVFLSAPSEYLVIPTKASPNDINIFISRIHGLISLYVPITLLTLKDAADRDRMASTTFKALELGCMIYGLSNAVIIAWAYGLNIVNGFMPLTSVAIHSLISLVSGFHYITVTTKTSSIA